MLPYLKCLGKAFDGNGCQPDIGRYGTWFECFVGFFFMSYHFPSSIRGSILGQAFTAFSHLSTNYLISICNTIFVYMFIQFQKLF